MSAKTVTPPALRPEIQEIASLTQAIMAWQDGEDSIDLIESKLLRFASLIDLLIAGHNASPWNAAEAPVMGRAIGIIFDLGYLMHPNWATVYAKSLIAAFRRTEADAPEDYDA